MDTLATVILAAATSGAVLLIISLGLAIVFGLLRVVNMAHGEFLMVGAFTTTTLAGSVGLPFWIALAAAPVASAAIGLVAELLLIGPLRGRLLDTLLATFGLSLILSQCGVLVFGPTSPGIATPLGVLHIGRYSISAYSLFLCGAAGALVLGTWLIYRFSRYGLLARATAQNPEVASALGVHARSINRRTFVFGCGLAGLSGGLLAPIASVSPSMGQGYLGQAFMTVITGGPAFLLGSTAAALGLGAVNNGVAQLTSPLWGLVSLLAAAIVVLKLRPTGLSTRWSSQL